ncbi:MAG: glycerol-3-phosphate dehydrogenase, partial [Pseudomonadota bacterium]|nr:glycerol-3-phosphate dehydrogenase [Pseudomonadota bacterium]
TAIKVGKPAARQASKASPKYVVSGCPLAGEHILQGIDFLGGSDKRPKNANHPIEILAKAYNL